ncbi:MAG TPA: class I tRNA ligase family protein, partial [Balneolaceae bacterium]|nr:class I tRNA ligase family protein [Balneolaceae bacterium]
DDFCDWYIEVCKADEYGKNMPKENLERALGFFEMLMKMLHPFMPFISEEIWQRIQERSADEALTISAWPEVQDKAFKNSVSLFKTVQDQITSVRNIQAEMNLSPKTELNIIIKPNGDELSAKLKSTEWIYRKLLPVQTISFDVNADKPKASAAAVVAGSEIYVPLEGLIDLDKERERIQKEIDRLEGFLKGVEKKLSNEGFVNNAPKDVVEKEKQKKADAETDLKKLKKQLIEFKE